MLLTLFEICIPLSNWVNMKLRSFLNFRLLDSYMRVHWDYYQLFSLFMRVFPPVKLCPYLARWWIWAWCPTTFQWKCWYIMKQTKVSELRPRMEWSKAVIWAGGKPWVSAWIQVFIEHRRWSVSAWSSRAYKWYVSVWFIESSPIRKAIEPFSSSKWWPDFSHDHGDQFSKKLHAWHDCQSFLL